MLIQSPILSIFQKSLGKILCSLIITSNLRNQSRILYTFITSALTYLIGFSLTTLNSECALIHLCGHFSLTGFLSASLIWRIWLVAEGSGYSAHPHFAIQPTP